MLSIDEKTSIQARGLEAVIRFAGGEELSYPVSDLTPMPKDGSPEG